MYALILNGKVIQIAGSQFPVAPPLFWRDAPEGCEVGWDHDAEEDEISKPVIPPEPINTVVDRLRRMVNNHLNSVAIARGFEGKQDLLSYLSSEINKFLNDANAFNAFRDSVWQTANVILNDVQSEQRPRPTKDEFIGMLPVISWPS